jgi:hypothetical protein
MLSLCLTISLAAADFSPQPTNSQHTELDAVNAEIDTLNNTLEDLRKAALTREMQAQPLMFDNWDEFAQKIKENEDKEKAILDLKDRIKLLIQKRDALKQLAPQK